jgi:hypothetical protein
MRFDLEDIAVNLEFFIRKSRRAWSRQRSTVVVFRFAFFVFRVE